MMLKFTTSLIAVCGLVMSFNSYSALEIVITEGTDTARPIAVVPFSWNGPGSMP
ncbi:MAG: TolB protein, partial [Paraglaciecola sp.]